MYQSSAPLSAVPQQDLRGILNERDSDARQQALHAAGAKNAVPPLPRSSHLRSKKNGIVFPWDPMLAEQRDIMECCDSTGNTDPEAWRSTVNEAEYTPAERDALLAEAQAAVIKQANAFSGKHEPTMEEITTSKGVEEATRMPYAAQPLDAYYHGIEDDLAALVRSTE